MSDNSTVTSWGILVQGYSTIRLNVSAIAGAGSRISNIEFSGYKVSHSGTDTSTTSNLLKKSGEQSWTVTVTDARGRTATETLTRKVYRYYIPSIKSFTVIRADSLGNADEAEGTYIAATPKYSIAPCGEEGSENNSVSVATIQYKLHTASSYTTVQTGAVSNTKYTFGSGNVSILAAYDVKFTLKDALNNSSTYVATVSSVKGISFGLNGQCARFGGPVQYDDRFECDWKAQFDSSILTPNGDLSGTGDYYKEDADTVSVSNSTWKDVASITLGVGIWLVWYTVRFASNATGRRQSLLSSGSNNGSALSIQFTDGTNAVNGAYTYLKGQDTRVVTSQTTFYLQAYQTSGSALNAVGRLYAIRIA